MENPQNKWRFVAGKIIYFYGPLSMPRCSMYGIFNYIYPKNGPNVGKYSSTMVRIWDGYVSHNQRVNHVKPRFVWRVFSRRSPGAADDSHPANSGAVCLHCLGGVEFSIKSIGIYLGKRESGFYDEYIYIRIMTYFYLGWTYNLSRIYYIMMNMLFGFLPSLNKWWIY